jgi:hypothetical protein
VDLHVRSRDARGTAPGRARRAGQPAPDARIDGLVLTREVVYLWVDGVYVKAGLEKDKAASLVV